MSIIEIIDFSYNKCFDINNNDFKLFVAIIFIITYIFIYFLKKNFCGSSEYNTKQQINAFNLELYNNENEAFFYN